MGRRIASQVHRQAARLLRAEFMQQEPLWFKAVLEFPPIPLPPRAPPSRSSYDLPTRLKPQTHKLTKPPKPKTPEVVYIDDELRRRFFRDHPFEAYRERSLVESAAVEDEHPVRAKEWTRLSQRGTNPIPEDAVQFAVNLHEHHNIPLSKAYATSVKQFRSLRSEHHIATMVAAAEAKAYGATFGKTETEKLFEKETKQLASWSGLSELEKGLYSTEARKRWKAVTDSGEGTWTKGQAYVRLWETGVRPDYAPRMTAPAELGTQLDEDDPLNIKAQIEGQRT